MDGEQLTKPAIPLQSDTIDLGGGEEVTVSLYLKEEGGAETFLVGAMVFTPETHAGLKVKVVKEWEPLQAHESESKARMVYDELMEKYSKNT